MDFCHAIGILLDGQPSHLTSFRVAYEIAEARKVARMQRDFERKLYAIAEKAISACNRFPPSRRR